MSIEQNILIPPTVEELNQQEKELVNEEQDLMAGDPWWREHQTANFSPEINPIFIGFYINRRAHKKDAIMPTFKTDNGIFAVKHSKEGITDFTVNENEVYRIS